MAMRIEDKDEDWVDKFQQVRRLTINIGGNPLLCEYYRLTENNKKLVRKRVTRLHKLFPNMPIETYITTCDKDFKMGYRHVYGHKWDANCVKRGRQFSDREIINYRVG